MLGTVAKVLACGLKRHSFEPRVLPSTDLLSDHLLHSTGPGIRACVRKHVAYAMEGATEGPADLVAWGYRPVLGDADASKMRGTFAKYAVLLRALLKDSVAS